jgi:hypothetical protein
MYRVTYSGILFQKRVVKYKYEADTLLLVFQNINKE